MNRLFAASLACLCIACFLLSSIIFISPTPFIKLYILGIERSLNLDISFSLESNRLFDKWRFKDVGIKSKKGYGINIEDLTFDPSFRQLLTGKYEFKCSAQNIKLYGKWPMLESVASLVSKESGQDKILKTVEAAMVVSKGRVKIFKLKAEDR